MTGRKTLGFFVNHVNGVLLRCPPLQVIATISPRGGGGWGGGWGGRGGRGGRGNKTNPD